MKAIHGTLAVYRVPVPEYHGVKLGDHIVRSLIRCIVVQSYLVAGSEALQLTVGCGLNTGRMTSMRR